MPVFARLAVLCCSLLSLEVFALTDQEAKLMEVQQTLEQVFHLSEQGLPRTLLSQVSGIAVIPAVTKVGFVVGGHYGKGVLLLKGVDGRWSNPVFVSLKTSASGWQIGAQSNNIVMLFHSRDAANKLLSSDLLLGTAEAKAAAGPVAGELLINNDGLPAVWGYAHSHDRLLGVALDGAVLKVIDDDNAAYYLRPGIRAVDIVNAPVEKAPLSAQQLQKLLMDFSN